MTENVHEQLHLSSTRQAPTAHVFSPKIHCHIILEQLTDIQFFWVLLHTLDGSSVRSCIVLTETSKLLRQEAMDVLFTAPVT